MIAFIDAHRAVHGVEPICKVLPIALSTYSAHAAISDRATPCPADRVNRPFQAPRPNALWVADFTYVATWQGFVCVAFVIGTFACRIVGWRVSRTAHAGFVLDALEEKIAALEGQRPLARRRWRR